MPDLAGDAGHLRGERVELVHHRVDRVLELQDLALHVHRDLLVELAAGHGGRHLGDVPHLAGQVAGHRVDVVGQVLPRPRHAFHLGLTAQLALGADLAGDASDFRGEGAELVYHGVHRLADPEELAHQRAALDVERHRLGQVALGNGADDAGHLAGGLHQVADQGVDRADRRRPRAARARQGGALCDPALLADREADALELLRHIFVKLGDLVQRVRDLARHAGLRPRHPHREIALAKPGEHRQQLLEVESVRCGRAIGGRALRGSPIGGRRCVRHEGSSRGISVRMRGREDIRISGGKPL